ncbi:MAG: hypothetical protein Q8K82_06445 [Gemmatimonadaceae bacterium]|nr:hypothetical protein [Gemmatimonadaceae bacterium]
MATPKAQRVAAAGLARHIKRARETNALRVAFCHAVSLLDILRDEKRLFDSSGAAFDEDAERAQTTLEPTRASRVTASLLVFYAAVNTVVEGWCDPKQSAPRLSDPAVDALMIEKNCKLLRDFRNSFLHHTSLLDARFVRFSSAHSELHRWALELYEALRAFFVRWGATVTPPAGSSDP